MSQMGHLRTNGTAILRVRTSYEAFSVKTFFSLVIQGGGSSA